MKRCPYCAEEIQDEAIVCKHCRRDLPLSPQGVRQGRRRTFGWMTRFLVIAGLVGIVALDGLAWLMGLGVDGLCGAGAVVLGLFALKLALDWDLSWMPGRWQGCLLILPLFGLWSAVKWAWLAIVFLWLNL